MITFVRQKKKALMDIEHMSFKKSLEKNNERLSFMKYSIQLIFHLIKFSYLYLVIGRLICFVPFNARTFF
jgi:hypothetical protein